MCGKSVDHVFHYRYSPSSETDAKMIGWCDIYVVEQLYGEGWVIVVRVVGKAWVQRECFL